MNKKNILIACILTGTVTPASASVLVRMFRSADDLPANWQKIAEKHMGTGIAQSPDLWLKQQKEWVLRDPEAARHVRKSLEPPTTEISNTTKPMQQRPTQELVQDDALNVWRNNSVDSPTRKKLDDLISNDPEYAELLAHLSKQWDQKHKYRQFVEKNPITAATTAALAGGTVAGGALGYTIAKPAEGTTVIRSY